MHMNRRKDGSAQNGPNLAKIMQYYDVINVHLNWFYFSYLLSWLWRYNIT